MMAKINLIEGYEYTSGYHGTDLITARTIFDTGFDRFHFDTHFAPSDDYELAKAHGNKNACRASMGKYAILDVNFNQVGRIASDYGNIVFYNDKLASMTIRGMDIYMRGETEDRDLFVDRIIK